MTGTVTAWTATELGLEVIDTGGPGQQPVGELVQPGLRRNPRRAHLLVSTVLGKHIAADPLEVIDAGRRLGATVRTVAVGPVDVLAMCETATGLGHCVAAALAAEVYIHSTRRDFPGAPVYAAFEEGHSHATNHALFPTDAALLQQPRPLVLVDDEITSGSTALAAIRALHAVNPRPEYVLASLVDMRAEHHCAAVDRTAADLGTRIESVSLATGRVTLPPDLIDAVAALDPPELNVAFGDRGARTSVAGRGPSDVPEGGRHGFLLGDQAAFDTAVDDLAAQVLDGIDRSRPVVVVGHEEFMYLPLSLARRLAGHGVDARFQTTTRSPAYVRDVAGYPLRRGYQFVACETDQTGPRFMYNGRPGAQLLLVVDAAADTPMLAGPDGIEDVMTAAGYDVTTLVVGGADLSALREARRW